MPHHIFDPGLLAIIFLGLHTQLCCSIILSGAPDSYARYPKWAHSYENSLSLEIKTRQSNGLILYTDDSGVNGNFYAISINEGYIQLDFRLGDNSNDFRHQRPVTTIRIDETKVDDDRWHTLRLHQSFENVKLELDYTLVFKILNQRSFVFGNIHKNSDVFVGGIPSDIHLLSKLSSPLRRFSVHLAANIRNLVYRLYPQGETSPQLIDGHGIRHTDDNHCRPSGVLSREVFQCQNGGVCFSTNEGPRCDCSDSDYEGKLCDIEKTDAELTFSGNEWIGYDVSANISAIVRAKTENITLSFKTVHGTSVIFFAGDEKSFIHLMLENGALIASSKLEGTDVRIIRLFNKFPAERYDDDTWHSVTLERTLQVHSEKTAAVHMKLRVDDQKDQIRQYAPEMDWIYNSFVYIGGVPNEHKNMGVNKTPFRGCLKMVRYIADSMKVNFVSLADESYGESIIRTGGDLSFSCKNPAPPPDILSFHPGATPLLLTKWTSDAKGGSISFQFRSTEPDGLILLLSSMIDNSSEYLAFELIDGHLYMIIDLGAGSIRLQTTFKRLTDSNSWNSVYMERIRRHGKIIVNSHKTDFNTPGTSANLDVVDPILIGGLPQSNFVYPSSIWSITLRKSFVGCIKNVRINGISAKIASAFESVNSTGITLGCPSEKDNCSPNPCHNYGKCSSGTLSFKCDCSQTTMAGSTCNTEPVFYSIDGEQKMLSIYPRTVLSEAEDIEIRFKTEQSLGCLVETRSNAHPSNFLAVFLLDGMLHIVIQTVSSKTVHMWGEPVSDSKWHTAKVKRRGNNMLLYFDGKWGSSYTLNSSLVVEVDEVVGARSFKSDERFQAAFRGHISQLSFNSVDLLNKIRKESKPNKENKGLRNIKSKLLSVSFTNSTGFISFSADKISSLTGNFRVSFKFQTLVRTCLLFAYLPVSSNDYLMIQLINARIRYSFRFGKSEGSILSPRLPNKQHLSDMRWHSILLYQNQDTLDHVILIDNTTSTIHLNSTAVRNVIVVSGPAVLGGVPPSLSSHTALSAQGFRGCISTLRLNDRLIDILEEAQAMHSITKGCNGPMSRCSPFACANGGRCIQQWTNIFCDCTFTSFAGTKCSEPATTFSFNSEVTGLYYEYPPGEMPSTSKDFMVIAFSTKRLSGVLFSVESSAEPDFFTLYLDGGMLQLKYNLGSGLQHFGIFSKTVSDGKLHTVKLFRFEYNVTLQLDNSTPVRYTPKDGIELTTLNMHWRLVVGASMNSLHIRRSEKTRFIRDSGDFTVYNSFNGEISGVNFNGISILDLYVQGSPRVFAIGPVKKIHESPPVQASSEEIMHEGMENSADALIESLGASCLSVEEHDSCYVETEQTGFFTPVIPSAVTAPRRATTNSPTSSTAVREKTTSSLTFSTLLSTTTTRLAKPKTTPSFTVYPVRPTTPMGELLTTTMKYNTGEAGEFPRTALVMIASLTVVLLIAIVVFCVFRCRQNPPPNDHYPMAVNGVKAPSGYTAIAPDLSPPLGVDPSTQPLLGRQPQVNGNGYQPLKGSVMPNGMYGMNGNGRSIMNGNGKNGGMIKKKDFKEWYV